MFCTLFVCFFLFYRDCAGFSRVLLVLADLYPIVVDSNSKNFEIRRSQRLTVKKNDSPVPDSQNKSVFRDIIVNYNRKIENNSENKCFSAATSGVEFSKGLFDICKYYSAKNVLSNLEKELKFEIYKCNSIIMGEPIVKPEKPRNAGNESPKQLSLTVQLFPKSTWVYNTPENQKIKCAVLDSSKSNLQPVILRTTNRHKTLYELDEKNVVFGGNRGDVVFDDVMAQPIVNFSKGIENDWVREETVVSENENVSRFLIFLCFCCLLWVILLRFAFVY